MLLRCRGEIAILPQLFGVRMPRPQRMRLSAVTGRTFSQCPSRRPRLAAWLMLLAGLASLSGCNTLSARSMNAEGVRLFREGQYQQAIQEFQQAAYADPKNADAYYNIAAIYHRTASASGRPADYEQAETYYNQCLDRNPNHRDCYRGLAVMLVEQDRTEEAFRLVEGWADRQPSLADPKVEMARLYQEFGDPKTAKDYLLAAVEMDPNNPRALAALGKIREDEGDRASALALYQRSLWYDRFQSQVASRAASLQASLGSAPASAPNQLGGTRTVTRSGELRR